MNFILFQTQLQTAIKVNFGYGVYALQKNEGKENLIAKAIYFRKLEDAFPGSVTEAKEVKYMANYDKFKNDHVFRRKLALVNNYLRLECSFS